MNPLSIYDKPWLYATDEQIEGNDVGKWMLFYNKNIINDKWKKVLELFKENKLEGVINVKVSTNMKNQNNNMSNSSVIVLYCDNSRDKKTIINIGKKIQELMEYTEQKCMYYKLNYNPNMENNKRHYLYQLKINKEKQLEILITQQRQ